MTPEALLNQWIIGLRISHRGHHESAKHYEHLHWLLSLPTVIVSAALGTTVFAGLQNSTMPFAKTSMAILSVMTVALSSLQGALRFGERSERHKSAAAQIGEVRRALEERVVLKQYDEQTMDETRKKWDATDRQAPTIPSRIYNKATQTVAALEKEYRALPPNQS
jgi:hypothetical protein